MYLTIFNHLNYPLNMKTSAIISDFNTCDDHQAYPFYCTLPYISFQIYIQVTNLVSYWELCEYNWNNCNQYKYIYVHTGIVVWPFQLIYIA